MNVVQELESRFLPSLDRMAKELERLFPDVKTNIWSWSVGTLTEYDGHNMGVESLLPLDNPNQPDNIALSISVKHITTEPRIDGVDVCWGHGYIEAEIFPNEVAFTHDILNKIEDYLPKLFDAMKIAIRRGHPPDE